MHWLKTYLVTVALLATLGGLVAAQLTGIAPMTAAVGGIIAFIVLGGIGAALKRGQRASDEGYFDRDSYRGHHRRDAVGPDGKSLTIGHVVRSEPEFIDELEEEPPVHARTEPSVTAATSSASSAPTEAAQPVPTSPPNTAVSLTPTGELLRASADMHTDATEPKEQQAAPVRETADLDGITLVLKRQTYTTPLWGRKPAEAFRDLYAYALYHQLHQS